MSERIIKYQHWIVAIGSALAVASAIYNGVYAYASVNLKVDTLSDEQVILKNDLNTRPTKTEFEMMKGSVDKIDKNVQNLTDYLLRKK